MINTNKDTTKINLIYRLLRNSILLSDNIKDIKSLLITSEKKGEGKTAIGLNLALTVATSGLRTLFIDCSTNSFLNEVIELPEQNYSVTILTGQKNESTLISKTSIDNLSFFTCSDLEINTLEELTFCNKLIQFLLDVKEEYDFIVIDTPSILEVSYVQILSQSVDGCILVVEAGKSNLDEVKKAKQLLQDVNAKILGTILNRTDEKIIKRDVHEKKCKNKGGEVMNPFHKFSIKKKKKVITTSLILAIMVSISLGTHSPILTVKADTIKIIDVELKEKDNYTNFPFQAQVDEKINVTGVEKGNTVKVLGDSIQIIIIKDSTGKYIWTPTQRGIFKLVLTDSIGNILNSKKVYVNSREYYQITDLSFKQSDDAEDGTEITLSSDKRILIGSLLTKSKVNIVTSKISVGDPNVWKKTIKTITDENYISSKLEFPFNFNYGNYYVEASLKNKNSIEYEDAVAKNYNQRGTSDITLKLNTSINGAKIDKLEKTYLINTRFNFVAETTSKDGNSLQYIYLIGDAKGIHKLSQYNSTGNIEWIPSSPGNYIIYAKVRRLDKPDGGNADTDIYNSYETQVVLPITISDGGNKQISITGTNICESGNADFKAIKSAKLKTHALYQLKVNAKYNNIDNSPNLMYKAYSLHDNVCEQLCEFSSSSIIPFYPKSIGSYKIFVMVKDASAGASQVTETNNITINANLDL